MSRECLKTRLAQTELARGRWRGPLHGIPVGLKDIYDLAGMATTGHSRLFLDNVATADARCVARLRAAGAVAFQFAGRPWDDLFVLDAAKTYQEMTTHHLARPDLAGLAA